LPEPNNAEVTATPGPTAFELWNKTPADEIEISDTAAEANPAKVETAPASEPEKKTTQEEDEDDEALPKGLKKRFRKLTGKIRDLETQLATTTKPAAAAPAAEAKQAVATPPATKPKLESFDTYEAFNEALIEFNLDQREARKAEADAKKNQTETAATQQKEWNDRVAEAKTRHDDWEDVVEGATDVPITGAMRQTIIEMDRGPDVVHFLASNPDEAKRISKLAPFAQARELGKIEDKLEPIEAPEPKKAAITKAPAPAKTVRGSSASDAGKEPDPKDYAKWSKWKDRQEAREAA
jgi:hypothetical protein